MTTDYAAISRRKFLQSSAIGAAGLAAMARTSVAKPDSDYIAAIDAHTHFYDPTRPQGVPWPGKQDQLLYRKTLPSDLEKLTRNLGVRSTIAVEASPWVEDNQWLLEICAASSFVVGVVGNLDPASDDFPRNFARFSRNQLYRGIRINHADLRRGLESKTYLANLDLLTKQDRQLDVNGGPDMPADVARLAKLQPELRIVINHCANLHIDGKPVPKNWLAGMREASAGRNVFCKISALVDGTGKTNGDAPADIDFYRPMLDKVWDLFGEDRLIYASNWPVCLRAASYETVFNIAHSYVSQKGATAAEKFFRQNALRAYKPVTHAAGG